MLPDLISIMTPLLSVDYDQRYACSLFGLIPIEPYCSVGVAFLQFFRPQVSEFPLNTIGREWIEDTCPETILAPHSRVPISMIDKRSLTFRRFCELPR